jgi:hypothetical protein
MSRLRLTAASEGEVTRSVYESRFGLLGESVGDLTPIRTDFTDKGRFFKSAMMNHSGARRRLHV